MANHVRQQIRAAAVTALTGLTTTTTNVFVKPAWSRSNGELPALEIQTGDDSVDIDLSHQTSSGVAYYRRLELIVECLAKTSAGVQDTLDTMAKEVEVALYADETLGGLAKSIETVESSVELSTEGEKPIGRLTLTFEYLYTVRGGDPSAAL